MDVWLLLFGESWDEFVRRQAILGVIVLAALVFSSTAGVVAIVVERIRKRRGLSGWVCPRCGGTDPSTHTHGCPG